MRDYHPDDYERRENPVHDAPEHGGAMELRSESAGFVPRGKFHLVSDSRSASLCGKRPRAIVWNVSANREDFERLCPERICKLCIRAEKR